MDVRVDIGERKGDTTCPFCRAAVPQPDAWLCPRCLTPHHVDCARENGKCTLLGCGGEFGGPTPRPATRRASWAPLILLGIATTTGAFAVRWSRPRPAPDPAPPANGPVRSGEPLDREAAIGRIAANLLRIENAPERWTARDRGFFTDARVDYATLALGGSRASLDDEVRTAIYWKTDAIVMPRVAANLEALLRTP